MSERIDQQARFLLDLAQALHISGMHSHELERQLNAVGQQIGVRVVCFAVLTMLTLSITTEDNTQRVVMLRLPAYDYNMVRLIALEKLIRNLDSAECRDEQ